ncbi:hypothetical protein Hanom_Chr05g00472471 [Helianthus anomalus]
MVATSRYYTSSASTSIVKPSLSHSKGSGDLQFSKEVPVKFCSSARFPPRLTPAQWF